MKRAHFILRPWVAGCCALWLAGLGGQGAESKPLGSVVRFEGGDTLHGTISSIDGNGLARFASPAIKELMEFSTLELSSIYMQDRTVAMGSPRQSYVVGFINGDELTGNISLLNKDKMVLDTWYAGSLSIPREKVRSISLARDEKILYEGPTGLEGWVVSDSKEEDGQPSDSWKYRDGVFYGKEGGGIARELNLPDKASIDMDVAWRDYLQLTITIYTKSLRVYQLGKPVRQANGAVVNVAPPAQEGPGFYAIQLNRNTLYLLTVTPQGQVVNSPMDVIRELTRKNKARLSVRVNKSQKTITLLIDGKFVKTWKEGNEFAGQGTAMRLVQQGQTLVNVSNIKVAEWDGKLDMPSGSSAKVTTDLVHLRNEDTLSGKLEGINDGKLSFTTSFGTLEIPVERVAQVEMPVPDGDPVPLPPRAVRGRMFGRGMLTFQLEEWVDERIVAASPNFGKASFNPAVFERVEFNVE